MANSIQLTLDAADWQRQVSEAIKVLDKFAGGLESERKKMLEYAAIPLVTELQRRAPVGSRIHVRYSKQGRERSRKGEGRRAATYHPGNTRGAFRILDLRRTDDIYVGAKLARSGTKGTFGKGRYDAYYLHMIEFGTVHKSARPFVRPSWISAAPHCIRRINNAARLYAEKFTRQHAVK